MQNQLLRWTPSISEIDKTKTYLISVDDLNNIDLNAYTVFVDNGLFLKMSGIRLFYLKMQEKKSESQINKKNNKKLPFKSLKNVCFIKTNTRSEVVQLIKSKLTLPPCMESILNEICIRPRGDRFRKRFIFNCYLANLLTCTRCDKKCLIKAMDRMYDNDNKCTQEFYRIIFNNNLYKPPNCVNMKNKDNLCFKTSTCRGSNPLCNF
jgi:lef-2